MTIMSDFDRCVEFVLAEEGGTANHPADPGGLTRYGISKRAYPNADIASLTRDAAKAIYRRDYWNPVRGDELPAGIDLLVFDCAVNQGTGVAIRFLQIASDTTVDGEMGPDTLRAANKTGATDRIAVDFCALRAARYARSPKIDVFGKGWFRRLLRAFGEAQRVGGWS